MKRSASITDFLLVTVAVTVVLLSLLPVSPTRQSPGKLKAAGREVRLTSPESLNSDSEGEISLASIDGKTALSNWQNEVAAFYAAKDRTETDHTTASPATASPATASPATASPATASPATASPAIGDHTTSTPTATDRDDQKQANTVPASESLSQRQPTHRIKGTVQAASFSQPIGAKRSIASPSTSRSSATVRSGIDGPERRVPTTFLFAVCGGLLLGLGYLEWSRQTPVVSVRAIEFHAENDEISRVDFDPQWGGVRQSKAVVARRVTLLGIVVWAFATLVC